MNEDLKKHVEDLLKKASTTNDSREAMAFAQAALNAANALCSLHALRTAPR